MIGVNLPWLVWGILLLAIQEEVSQIFLIGGNCFGDLPSDWQLRLVTRMRFCKIRRSRNYSSLPFSTQLGFKWA